ncbi:hypothetical protein GCM10009827_101430 [Dactylosporangium maewongense]|uniref:Uncharacterized protein n=1 Tax=Dactylosporangium maewongense TaxID=634393 RepID=A0ABP4NMP3_9ACTN
MSAALRVMSVLPGPFGASACADSLRDQLPATRFVSRWLAPDVTSVNQLILDLALLIQDVVEHGGAADMLDDRTGVAVWHPTNRPLPELASLRRSSVDGAYAERWATLEHILRSAVPAAAAPGGQLLLFAVAAGPGRAGIARAAALLGARHLDLNTAEEPATTVAFGAAGRWLLARHGWTTTGFGRLPDGTPWWPMHRPPNPTSTNLGSVG